MVLDISRAHHPEHPKREKAVPKEETKIACSVSCCGIEKGELEMYKSELRTVPPLLQLLTRSLHLAQTTVALSRHGGRGNDYSGLALCALARKLK